MNRHQKHACRIGASTMDTTLFKHELVRIERMTKRATIRSLMEWKEAMNE
jgi:hypothetical protein